MILCYNILVFVGVFMIYSKDTSELRKELLMAEKLLKETPDPEVRFAMVDYISNLKDLIYHGNNRIISYPSSYLQSAEHELECDKLNRYFLDDYLRNKALFRDYLFKILTEKENNNHEYNGNDVPAIEYSSKEFSEILYDFLKSIGLEKIFDRMIRNGVIYAIENDEIESDGLILYNPINGNANIFIRRFKYTLEYMFTLIHELGHFFDLGLLGKNPKFSNYYSYVSFMTEVISNLFTKLFLDFAIRNNLEIGTIKKILDQYNSDYYCEQFDAYMLSTLSSNEILSGNYIDIDEDQYYELFKDHFYSKEEAIKQQNASGYLDLHRITQYSNGNVVSTFLADEAKKNGFYNHVFVDFLRNRYRRFDSKLFERNNWTPERFGKIYRKELEIFRK